MREEPQPPQDLFAVASLVTGYGFNGYHDGVAVPAAAHVVAVVRAVAGIDVIGGADEVGAKDAWVSSVRRAVLAVDVAT